MCTLLKVAFIDAVPALLQRRAKCLTLFRSETNCDVLFDRSRLRPGRLSPHHSVVRTLRGQPSGIVDPSISGDVTDTSEGVSAQFCAAVLRAHPSRRRSVRPAHRAAGGNPGSACPLRTPAFIAACTFTVWVVMSSLFQRPGADSGRDPDARRLTRMHALGQTSRRVVNAVYQRGIKALICHTLENELITADGIS